MASWVGFGPLVVVIVDPYSRRKKPSLYQTR